MKIADLFAKLSLRPDSASFSAADRLIGRVKQGLAALASLAAVRWAAGLVEDVVDLGAHLSDMAKKTAVPAETLQELGYAADVSGSSMDELAGSLVKLSKLMDAAKRGGKEQAAALAAAGVKYKDTATGKLRPVEDVFEDLADHFKSMKDGPERAALAMRVFGRSGASLLPLLLEGRDGIQDMRKEFKDLGGEMSGEDADALESFGDEQHKISVAWTGIKIAIVKELLPAIKSAVSAFLTWVKANRAVIAARMAVVIRGLVTALTALGKALGYVFDALDFLIKNWRLTQVVLMAVIALIIALKYESIAAAAASAAAWVASMLPLIAMVALISGIILIVQDLYSWFHKGDSVLKDWLMIGIDKASEYLKEKFTEAVTYIEGRFQAFLDWVSQNADNKNIGQSASSAFQRSGLGVRQAQRQADAYASRDTVQAAKRRGIATPIAPDALAKRALVHAPDELGDITGGDLFNPVPYGKSYYVGRGASQVFKGAQLNASIQLKIDQTMTPEEAAARVSQAFRDEWGIEVQNLADSSGGKAVP